MWRVLSGMFKEKQNVKNLGFTNISMTHPFLHRGLPISCSQQGIYCRISKHTLKHTYEIPLLLPKLPWFVPYIFQHSFIFALIFLSLPPWQEAPQDEECAWSRNDRTMGSGLSPELHTHTMHTHTHSKGVGGGRGHGKVRCIGHRDVLFSH